MQTVIVEDQIALIVKSHSIYPDHPFIRNQGLEFCLSRIVDTNTLTFEHGVINQALIVGAHPVGIRAFVTKVFNSFFDFNIGNAVIP